MHHTRRYAIDKYFLEANTRRFQVNEDEINA